MFDFNQYKLKFRNIEYDLNSCELRGYHCLYIGWDATPFPVYMDNMAMPRIRGENVRHWFKRTTRSKIVDCRTVSHQLYCSYTYNYYR